MDTATKENRRIATGAVRRAVCMTCGAALMAAFLATGCSKEPETDVHGEPVLVNFTLDGFAPATRAALAEGSTVRVIASKAKTSPPLIPTHEEWVADQSYYLEGDRLIPCTVDAEGKRLENTDIPWEQMRLETGVAYDFHTITPALPLKEDDKRLLASALPNGLDYAYSYSRNSTFTDADASAGVSTVRLTALTHKCAGLNVRVILTAKGETLRSVRVSGLPSRVEPEAYYNAPTGSVEKGTQVVTWEAEAFGYEEETFTYKTTTPMPVRPISSSFGEAPLYVSLTTELSDGSSVTVTDSITQYALSQRFIATIVLSKGDVSDGGTRFSLSMWETSTSVNQIDGNSYPYVRGENTVVFRDENGYGSGYAYHGLWTFTPAHSESTWSNNNSGLNTVSASFEVASGDCGGSKTYKYDEALTACDGYSQGGGLWRLPTSREVREMNALQSQLTGVGKFSQEAGYWSATDYDGGSNAYFGVMGEPGTNPSKSSKGTYRRVRCIRDL